ncbi:hypothetical protein [Chitiniphilus shinanonensis]|uniref:hypothetical protein n=1 Tax=Chitiniphilus shinanonensis TaxID=553088 RepID=UPI00303B27AD
MSQHALHERLHAARRRTHAIGDKTFELLLPTQAQVNRVAFASDLLQFDLELVANAVTAWQGVSERDLGLPDDVPVACTAENKAAVFAERLDWYAVLGAFIRAETEQRAESYRSTEKNSRPGSMPVEPVAP